MDVMQSIHSLVKQFESGRPAVENQYIRVVKPTGNLKALRLLETVFAPANESWRGLGMIPLSGLQLCSGFESFDARKYFALKKSDWKEPAGCICGEILKGLKTPRQCPLFAVSCTPSNPVGACMVSAEGSCAIVHKYNQN